MKKISSVVIITFMFIVVFAACKKDSSPNNTVTVESLVGTYALKALIWNSSGTTINVYDSLDACEKDNLTTLNADKTLNFKDVGIVCDPAEDDNATWDLKGDSLYLSNAETSKITSFDGKTLVLTGKPYGTTDVIATSTFVKQ